MATNLSLMDSIDNETEHSFVGGPSFILSFDVGTKSLAYALLSYPEEALLFWDVEPILETEEGSLDIAPYGMKCLQSKGDSLRKRALQTCGRIWTKICARCNVIQYQSATVLVAIEDQIVTPNYGSIHNKLVQEALAGFFESYHNVAHVCSYDARRRLSFIKATMEQNPEATGAKALGAKVLHAKKRVREACHEGQASTEILALRKKAYGAQYRANKKASVACTSFLLRNDEIALQVLESFAPKPDDACDALLQAKAVAQDLHNANINPKQKCRK